MVRALASHQCGPGSNPDVDAICGLSLLFVFSFAPRGFSPGTPVFPSKSLSLCLSLSLSLLLSGAPNEDIVQNHLK